MYFLCKNGVYSHGVFWIGDDLDKGKSEADKAASLDQDDYHDWDLYRFVKPEDEGYRTDGAHDHVYQGIRTENKENITITFGGIGCTPVPASGVFSCGKRRHSDPWFTMNDKGDGFSEVDATDKNGVRVSFSLVTGSKSWKDFLDCDPFGENVFEVIENK